MTIKNKIMLTKLVKICEQTALFLVSLFQRESTGRKFRSKVGQNSVAALALAL